MTTATKRVAKRRIVTEIELPLYDLILCNGYEELDFVAMKILGYELEDMFYTAQRVRQGRLVLQVTGIAV